MPVISDPRTYSFARIPNTACLILANSDVAWSESSCETYATAKGIPLSNIKAYPLGVSGSWTAGNSPKEQTENILAFCEWLKMHWSAGNYRAILIGPGCPVNVAVIGGQSNLGALQPDGVGYPPFSHLVAGCPSFAREMYAESVTSPDYVQYVAWGEDGASRFKWGKINYRNGAPIPSALVIRLWSPNGVNDYALAYYLGLSDARVTSNSFNLTTTSLTSHASDNSNATLPSGVATQFYGNPRSRWLPVGRIGWNAWTSVISAENEARVEDIIDSSAAAEDHVSQPAPVFVMLENISGTDIVAYAGFANTLAGFGYDVDYCYRVANPNATAQTLCPTGSAAFASTAITSGAASNVPYYVLCGAGQPTDDPQTNGGIGYNTFLPEVGADHGDIGPSAGFSWAIRGMVRGGAAGNMDVSHRNTTEHLQGWIGTYRRLTGACGLELQPLGPLYCGCPSGDPLHRAFHFDPAGELTLIDPPSAVGISYGIR